MFHHLICSPQWTSHIIHKRAKLASWSVNQEYKMPTENNSGSVCIWMIEYTFKKRYYKTVIVNLISIYSVILEKIGSMYEDIKKYSKPILTKMYNYDNIMTTAIWFIMMFNALTSPSCIQTRENIFMSQVIHKHYLVWLTKFSIRPCSFSKRKGIFYKLIKIWQHKMLPWDTCGWHCFSFSF